MMRGYFGIGVENMKNDINYGTLFRTANILGVSFLFLIGRRFKRLSADTMRSERHIPLFEYLTFKDFIINRPFGCRLIGIEMTSKAKPLDKFIHPDRACYLLGAEDNGLSKEAIDSCDNIIVLPGERSMNVSVAGSIQTQGIGQPYNESKARVEIVGNLKQAEQMIELMVDWMQTGCTKCPLMDRLSCHRSSSESCENAIREYFKPKRDIDHRRNAEPIPEAKPALMAVCVNADQMARQGIKMVYPGDD